MRFGSHRFTVENVGGFELPKYGDLQVQEKLELMSIKKRILDRSAKFLDTCKDVSLILNISVEEAWEVINGGLNNLTAAQQLQVVPLLQSIVQSPEDDYAQKAVVMLLQSRLANLKDYTKDLAAELGIGISPAEAKRFDSVPLLDRLSSDYRKDICTRIVRTAPVYLFMELLSFLTGEETRWLVVEQEEAVDESNPKP